MKIALRLLMMSLLLLPVARVAEAGLYAATDALYLSDSFTTSTSASNSRTYYSLDIMANLDQKSRFYAGFHVHQFDSQDIQGTTTTALSSQDMGPYFKWVIGKSKMIALSFAYNISAKGTYQNGTTNSLLDGTSMVGSFDIMPEVAENLYVGVKLNYYSASYIKSSVGTTATNVAYSRTFLFPSLSLSWRR